MGIPATFKNPCELNAYFLPKIANSRGEMKVNSVLSKKTAKEKILRFSLDSSKVCFDNDKDYNKVVKKIDETFNPHSDIKLEEDKLIESIDYAGKQIQSPCNMFIMKVNSTEAVFIPIENAYAMRPHLDFLDDDPPVLEETKLPKRMTPSLLYKKSRSEKPEECPVFLKSSLEGLKSQQKLFQGIINL